MKTSLICIQNTLTTPTYFTSTYSSRATMLLHISLLVSAFIACSLGAQCAQDPDFPCVFTCNGTQFNLTDVFDYPYVDKCQISCGTQK